MKRTPDLNQLNLIIVENHITITDLTDKTETKREHLIDLLEGKNSAHQRYIL